METVKENLTENALAQTPKSSPWRYLFRVTASDKNANAAPSARESDLSAAVLIDLRHPRHSCRAAQDAQSVTITASAQDAASPLRRAEYS